MPCGKDFEKLFWMQFQRKNPAWLRGYWKEYLGQFSNHWRVSAKNQQLSFDSNEPGIVTSKKTCDGTEDNIEILKDQGFKIGEKRRQDFLLADCLNLGCVTYTRMQLWDLLSRRSRDLLQSSNKLIVLSLYFHIFWCKHFIFRRWWTCYRRNLMFIMEFIY